MLFGTRGAVSRCQCQRYEPRESFTSVPAEVRADRLRQQTDCGHPESNATSGLVAYLAAEPVGWCAVEPRSGYDGLVRVYKVPWAGRSEDPVVPPESWRASLCGFPVGGRGVLVVDRAHHARRAVPAVVVVEPVAPVQHDGLGLAGVLEVVS